MIIDLEDPRFEIIIDKDIEAKDLETVTLSLVPSTIELELLFYQRKWLHGKDALFTDFTNLLEQEICVDALLSL